MVVQSVWDVHRARRTATARQPCLLGSHPSQSESDSDGAIIIMVVRGGRASPQKHIRRAWYPGQTRGSSVISNKKCMAWIMAMYSSEARTSSLTPSLTHSLTHPLTHSLSLSFSHSLTLTLSHSHSLTLSHSQARHRHSCPSPQFVDSSDS